MRNAQKTHNDVFDEADYWVSQTRKYCDFCKCWITDNKPSVEFHEKGRRHQANVKKRLRTITKHSEVVQRENDDYSAAMRTMESAALAAYRKDIENSADYSSAALNQKLQDDNLALSGTSSTSDSCSITKLWNEARTKEGKSYYFNIMTNERVWTPPKEGYASISEQRELADKKAKKQLEETEKLKRREGLKSLQQIQKEEEEERARLAREKLKERRVVDDTPPMLETCGPLLEPGKTEPYGKWQTIKEQPVIDWQAPSQDYYDNELPIEIEPEPVVKEFKEKTVESLGGESSGVTFKKRKIAGNTKRNTRQRLNDD